MKEHLMQLTLPNPLPMVEYAWNALPDAAHVGIFIVSSLIALGIVAATTDNKSAPRNPLREITDKFRN